jgi:hypothetical protein
MSDVENSIEAILSVRLEVGKHQNSTLACAHPFASIQNNERIRIASSF